MLGFWVMIEGLTHHILNTWDFSDTIAVQAEVEYRREDGKTVTVPNAGIPTLEGDLVRDWQIYIDLGPVFAP